jgi:hypothetical protein
MFLATSSSVLRVVTSSTADLSVVCNWVETSSSGQVAGQQLTAISTATTTTVLSAPAASTVRRAVGLYISNTHATTASTVALEVYNGTTAYQLYEVTLAAGWLLFVGEDGRPAVFDNTGRALGNDSLGNGPAAVNSLNLVVLASDVVNNNATANTMQDVTGLSFPVSASETYWFEFYCLYNAAAGATGSRWSINGPSASLIAYESRYSLTSTTETVNQSQIAYDLPAASNATSPSTTNANTAIVRGFVRPTVSGNIIARFASEVSSSSITAKAGSLCQWVRVL